MKVNYFLESVKIPENILLGEVNEWNNNIWVYIWIYNKSCQIQEKTEYLWLFLFILVLDNFDFVVSYDELKINYHTNIEETEKDVIHEVLEDSRSISEAKGYNRLFK